MVAEEMSRSVSRTSRPDRFTQNDWMQTRPGERCLIRVPSTDTGGVYSFVEIVSEPGDGTPMHVHQNEDEFLFVLEGTVRCALSDKVFDSEAGTMITLPRNIPHAWGNRSSSILRLAFFVYPGGVEEAMRVIARGHVTDLAAMAKTFGVNVLGPTPF
jgi:quercetin dioxygenase-like cupin family protein